MAATTTVTWKLEFLVPTNRQYTKERQGTWATFRTGKTKNDVVQAWETRNVRGYPNVRKIRIRQVKLMTETLSTEEMDVTPVSMPKSVSNDGSQALKDLLTF